MSFLTEKVVTPSDLLEFNVWIVVFGEFFEIWSLFCEFILTNSPFYCEGYLFFEEIYKGAPTI